MRHDATRNERKDGVWADKKARAHVRRMAEAARLTGVEIDPEAEWEAEFRRRLEERGYAD